MKTLHVTAGLGGQLRSSAWILETNALRCGGKYLWVWGQMPLSAWVDVLTLSFSLFIFDSVALSRNFSHVYLVAHCCHSRSPLLALSSVCLLCVLSPSLSLFFQSSSLSLACFLTISFCLSVSSLPFLCVLSHSVSL